MASKTSPVQLTIPGLEASSAFTASYLSGVNLTPAETGRRMRDTIEFVKKAEEKKLTFGFK